MVITNDYKSAAYSQIFFDLTPLNYQRSVNYTCNLHPQQAVDIRYSRRLPKNLDTMKLKRIFQVPMKT